MGSYCAWVNYVYKNKTNNDSKRWSINGKEFDTYKVGTVANSCSTMHKIADREFTIDDFSTEHLIEASKPGMEALVSYINVCRNAYVETNNKEYWWQMIQLLPSSYNQKRTVMLSYEVLANIYKSRKGHKLDEWSIGFCDWIKSLLYSELITGDTYEHTMTMNTKNITSADCNSLNAIASLLNHSGLSKEAGVLLNIQSKLEDDFTKFMNEPKEDK